MKNLDYNIINSKKPKNNKNYKQKTNKNVQHIFRIGNIRSIFKILNDCQIKTIDSTLYNM